MLGLLITHRMNAFLTQGAVYFYKIKKIIYISVKFRLEQRISNFFLNSR